MADATVSGFKRDEDFNLVVVGPGGSDEAAQTAAATDGSASFVKFASISAASSGANTLVAAVTGKKIRVLGYVLVAANAVNANFESGTTDISGVMSLPAFGGVSYAGGREAPAFETASGAALGLTLGSAVQVSGHISYIEI